MSQTETVDAGEAAAVAEALMQRRFSLMAAQVMAVRWSFVVMSLVVAAVAWQAAAPTWILTWFSAAMVVFVLRVRWLVRHAALPQEPASYKVRYAVVWNAALGLVYGMSAAFMLQLDQAMSAVITTIVVSSTAGALAISGPLPPVYLAYTLGIMLPFAVVWAATGGVLGIGLAALMGMSVTLQYRFARNVSETFTESFLIRRENEQLVGQLTVARDRADAASVAKTRFLAAASHDLRQPLHALSLQSSALLLDPFADDAPAIAASIAESVEDVSTLLDSLLDISKLDAGTLVADMRSIHLSRLLDSLARSFAPWITSKGLRFHTDIAAGQVAVTDPLLLERVLRNLVDNAIKFTRVGTVGLSLVVRAETFEVSVRDTGIGIPPALQSKVFEEFYQVGRHAHGRTRGLGLGLSIVSRLAQLLGMAVELKSTPGEGTTISLSIPRVNADALLVAAAPAASVSCDFAGLRVLILDDEPSICAAMATLLRRLGCDVASAATIADARAQARTFYPRIVLADYRLGDDSNGIDAISQLRFDDPGLLALLVSGDTAPDRLREASASGLELLHKPVSLDQLKRALSALVADDTAER